MNRGKRWDIATGELRGPDASRRSGVKVSMDEFTADTSKGNATRVLRYSNGKYYPSARRTTRWSAPFYGLSAQDEQRMRHYKRKEQNKKLMNCRDNIKTQGTHGAQPSKPERNYLPNASADLICTYLENGGLVRFDMKSHRRYLMMGDVKVAYVQSQVFAQVAHQHHLTETNIPGTFFMDYTKEAK